MNSSILISAFFLLLKEKQVAALADELPWGFRLLGVQFVYWPKPQRTSSPFHSDDPRPTLKQVQISTLVAQITQPLSVGVYQVFFLTSLNQEEVPGVLIKLTQVQGACAEKYISSAATPRSGSSSTIADTGCRTHHSSHI